MNDHVTLNIVITVSHRAPRPGRALAGRAGGIQLVSSSMKAATSASLSIGTSERHCVRGVLTMQLRGLGVASSLFGCGSHVAATRGCWMPNSTERSAVRQFGLAPNNGRLSYGCPGQFT